MNPFLKWAGGKRWFIAKHANLLSNNFKTYLEPFLGSATTFFFVTPSKAILSDLNDDLISTFTAIKNDWKSVVEALEIHHQKHSHTYYYQIRQELPNSINEKAARFIYLNRTCFNGIYRVNSKGKFNVPIGTRSSVISNADNFATIAEALSRAELKVSDFEETINRAKRDDLVFADPPYTVRHNNNGFIKYNEKIFSWDDQIRLAKTLNKARMRGVKIVLTNANNPSVRELYEGKGFLVKTVSRFSSISASPENRKQFEELVILANPD